jgi:hypothetical protein
MMRRLVPRLHLRERIADFTQKQAAGGHQMRYGMNEKTEYCVTGSLFAGIFRAFVDFPEEVEVIEPVGHMEDEILPAPPVGGGIIELLKLVIDAGKDTLQLRTGPFYLDLGVRSNNWRYGFAMPPRFFCRHG